MEVCEEIISYPYIKYTLKVLHVTSRMSTAFEWLFLEVLTKAKDTAFQTETLEDFFQNYFLIDKADKLLMPILKRLYDLQAVDCEKLDDDISLSELTLADVDVLPLGKEMQQKGLLPGEHLSNILEVVYDVSRNQLITDRNRFDIEPRGVSVGISNDGTLFPERLVRNYLEAQKQKNTNKEQEDNKSQETTKKKNKKKKQKTIDWIKDNTEIGDVLNLSQEICYDNVKHKVQLQNNLIWKIESNKDTLLDAASLEKFENPPPTKLLNCPMTEITDPDTQIEQIIMFRDLDYQIQKYLYNDSFVNNKIIVDYSFFDENKFFSGKSEKNTRKSVRSVIVYNAPSFSVKGKNNNLVVYIPEAINQSRYIYANERFCVKAEKFNVKAADVSRELTFAYLPKNVKININNCISLIVERYYKENPAVLLLLNDENDSKNEFRNRFDKLLSNSSLEERNTIISEINKLSLDIYGKRSVSEEDVFNQIINKNEIERNVSDYNSAKKIIEDYYAFPVVRSQVLRNLLNIVLECLAPTDSLEDIWMLIDFIKQKSPESIGYLDKNGVIIGLYSLKARNELFEKAFTSKIKKTHCDFEERALSLFDKCKKLNSTADEKKLREEYNSWKSNYGNFIKKYGTLETAEKYNNLIESRMKPLRNNNGGKKK